MKFLQELEQNNQLPIIFIGPGVTQRYFQDVPSWDDMLQLIWSEVQPGQSYGVRYQELAEVHVKRMDVETALADELERAYDRAFFQGKVAVEGLTRQRARMEELSPFRWRIAQAFSGLTPRDGMYAELQAFKTMLQHARVVITTNYDTLIEQQLGATVSVKVGTHGLFEPTLMMNEVYKLSGSVEAPETMMITTKDYQQWSRTSAIINAKVLGLLPDAPILLLGYTTSDPLVRSLFQDLAVMEPVAREAMASRIGLVTCEPGRQNVVDHLTQSAEGVHYTQLMTDNYTEIYQAVAKLDQGLSPAELAKYQQVLQHTLKVKGAQGELKQTLIDMVEQYL